MSPAALSVAYGFDGSAIHKSEERGGFLAAALREFERVGPCAEETGAYPRLSAIFGDLGHLLTAAKMDRPFAACAQRWPVEVTRERLVTWLPVWGLATEEEAAEVVAAFPKSFIAQLVEAQKTQTLLGVAYLVANRLERPLAW